ncbi:LPS O-antigen length regulator, partial [Pseudoalteromonas sp. SIMBA_153]
MRDVEPPKQPEPSSWEYVRVFQESILLVEKDEETPGLINISVSHKSPVVAHKWVEWLIEDINNHMR